MAGPFRGKAQEHAVRIAQTRGSIRVTLDSAALADGALVPVDEETGRVLGDVSDVSMEQIVESITVMTLTFLCQEPYVESDGGGEL